MSERDWPKQEKNHTWEKSDIPVIMEMPANHFVSEVNLDVDPPYFIAEPYHSSIDSDNKFKILIPKPLAYYLNTHFCGSEYMRQVYQEQGRGEVRGKLRDFVKEIMG